MGKGFRIPFRIFFMHELKRRGCLNMENMPKRKKEKRGEKEKRVTCP